LSCVEAIAPCTVAVELTIEGDNSGELHLSWLPVIEDLTYKIYRNSEFLAEVEGNEYIDSEVENYTEYCYTITAVCPGDVESAPSNEECGTIVGIEELQNDIKIYPNPANATLFVEGTGLKTISIYNMLGQMLETVETGGKVTTTINISAYQPALYFVEITLENGRKMNRQLIISR